MAYSAGFELHCYEREARAHASVCRLLHAVRVSMMCHHKLHHSFNALSFQTALNAAQVTLPHPLALTTQGLRSWELSVQSACVRHADVIQSAHV